MAAVWAWVLTWRSSGQLSAAAYLSSLGFAEHFTMTFRTVLKVIGGLLLTVLLGAVGSGVWEKILSPLLQYTSSEVSSTLSHVSASYSNSLYSSAAAYPGTGRGGDPATLLFIVLLFALLAWLLQDKSDNMLIRTFGRALLMYKGWPGAAYVLVLLITVIIGSAKQVEVSRIQRESLTKLEVIRPTVGEKRYLELRAQYFSIKTKKDYMAFIKALEPSEVQLDDTTTSAGKK